MTRIGELFAGYGGLGMGVQQVYGGEVAWYSEFDAAPSRVMAHHHPDTPNHGDITRIDWADVEPVDVLTGGFPCQDVSVAGRRAGMRDGTRSGLWAEMRTAIDQLRPALVVIENVGGLFSATANRIVEPCTYGMGDDGSGGHTVLLRAADAVLGDLATLGYDAEWVALRAADVGAPHGRLRVFITGHPSDPGGGGSRGWAEGPEPAWRDHAPVGSDPRGDGGRDHHGLTLLPTPVSQPSGNTPEEHLRKKPGRSVVTDLAIIAENDLMATGGQLLPTPTTEPMTGNGHARHLGAEVTAERFGPYAPAIQRWEQVLGRPAPAPTEPGKTRPRLSARFVEWLMGLPDGHVTDTPGLTRNQQLKALGNGVVPLQAATALSQLDHLRRTS